MQDTATRIDVKAEALEKIKAAELAIAEAAAAISHAIAGGTVKPCASYYVRLASAQSGMEGVRKEFTGERKGDRMGDARNAVMEALMEAASRS